jgi:hypothetical protein
MIFEQNPAAGVPASEVSAEVAAPTGDRPKTASSLLEQDAVRLAAALDDYELVSVTDIGGADGSGYWLTVRDERFGLHYEIDSHADYWDFLAHFAVGAPWQVKPVLVIA